MSALDNIIKSIETDTDDKIAMLKSKTKIECDQIISNAKSLSDKETEQMQKNAFEEIEKISSKSKTEKDLFEKQVILKMKQNLIDKAIQNAKQKLCSTPSDKYFDFIKTLICNNLPCESFILAFGEKDFSKLPNNFIDSIKNDDNVEVKTEKDSSFDYGVKIITKKVLIDFSIDSIFSDKDDIIRAAASKAIGLGDVQ
ncbi:MAG: V-type ATP synthase subunit E [Oscillospiraceae bacterium]|nr:V-type ATP synthase subunit E [Oscillospiraceae bacterium]